jgi:acyl-CoA synthetase (NDP forming)
MAAPGREVIVGVARDLQFGPAVLFGMGGVLVEALGDVSLRVVPLSGRDAEEMIDGIRGSVLLRGYRGGSPSDTASLRDLLLKVSDFAASHPEVGELDLNPVIVYEKGIAIVDARVVPAAGAK